MTARSRAVLLGALLDVVLGDQRRLHPVAGFGRAAGVLERAVWAPSRARGAVFATTLVAAAAALGHRTRGHTALEAAVLWTALGGRSLETTALRLADLVEAGDVAAARRLAPALMGRDPTALDPAELCRGAVESVAENTADAVVGALLWHALLGPAGSCGYRAANTLDAMVGHRTPRFEQFGWAAARLDDALTWPAARAAALLAVTLSGRRAAWTVLRRDGRAHPSPNAGRLEAAFAGALGIRLGGEVRYGARLERRPQLGTGELPGPRDVRRAVVLSAKVSVAAALLAALLAKR